MRSSQRFGIALAGVAALALTCAGAPAWAQRIEIGEHIPIVIDTPQNYAGATGAEEEVRWRYRLSHRGATYVAVHFVDFDLGPGDFLVVSDPNGTQSYTLEGRGKMRAGTFWARHIKGDTVLLELIVIGRDGGRGFLIDEYAAGYVDFGHPTGSRAICGVDDKENAVCYETSHPTEYERGRAVARLLISGSWLCTGWLASADNHLVTNDHCIGSAAEALNTDYEFMSEGPYCTSPNCQLCYPGTVFSGATYVRGSTNLDYALVQINSGNPADTYGYLLIDDRVAVVGEQIYIPQHPGGRAKEFAIFSTHPSDPGGVPLVYSITRPPCIGSGYYDVGYFADTEGGSSGSPVLATSNHKVIALHHCANCPNRGVPIDLVYDEIGEYLGPECTINEDCDDGLYCNGQELCVDGSCHDGAPIDCRDGVDCTDDWCDELNDACVHTPDDGLCDNGLFCDGAETCDPVADCQLGTDPCPGQDCDEVNDVCVPIGCDNDGTCEPGENCNSCPDDCISGGGGGCGNGVCEPPLGEDCLSCPSDCRGKQVGTPTRQYCCGDGDGTNPVDCTDPRCTEDGFACSNTPADPYCCGDLICEGAEDGFNCEVDCGPPPYCGDGNCDPGENQCTCPDDCGTPPSTETSCTDGADDDCDGLTDCADVDCANDPACTCLPRGEPCTLDSECCSNRCNRGACK